MHSLNTAVLVLAQEGNGSRGLGGFVMMILMLAIAVFVIIGLWKTYEKAGKPGWGALIPIYNVILLLEIAGRPIWWILLLLIPIVNLFVSIVVAIDVAKKFGKDTLYGLGLAFFPMIFYPVLGFGDARYQG